MHSVYSKSVCHHAAQCHYYEMNSINLQLSVFALVILGFYCNHASNFGVAQKRLILRSVFNFSMLRVIMRRADDRLSYFSYELVLRALKDIELLCPIRVFQTIDHRDGGLFVTIAFDAD